MNKLFLYRHIACIKTKSRGTFECSSNWHYMYVDEELATKRNSESFIYYNEFNEAFAECDNWPEMRAEYTLFRGRPRITILQRCEAYSVYANNFVSANFHVEYVDAPSAVSLKTLFEELPASQFCKYINDHTNIGVTVSDN